jgi:peptide-methionine (S)-S-oxide reductase
MKTRVLLIPAVLFLLLASFAWAQDNVVEVQLTEEPRVEPAPPPKVAIAVFGGGCFWCMEKPYDQIEGVYMTTSGYAGGDVERPTYEQVSAGGTGHVEVVQVRYDPDKVSYAKLLNTYWRNIDPLAVNRQFCDGGAQYRSVIFYADEEQRALAEASRAELQKRFEQPIATEVLPLSSFWPAEDYHQDYYQRNPIRYSYYRSRCGRDARLREIWGPPQKQ